MRRSRWAVCWVALALGVALPACGAGGHVVASRSQAASNPSGPPAPATRPLGTGRVLFTANFSDPNQAWPTGSDANQSLSLSGTDYVVQRKSPGQAIPLPTISGVSAADLVNVGVSATFQIGSAAPGDRVGVACRDIHGHAYVFGIGPGASSGQLSWSITRKDSATAARQLAGGTVPAPAAQSISLEGDCLGGGSKTAAPASPVTLVLSLGSQVIGQATDTQIPAPYFGAATIAVSTAHDLTSASFSSLQIRAASAS